MSFSLTDHPQWASLLSFIQQAEGPLILHISDTETGSYPFVEKLIAAVKPALILHTGDMADEWKAGRLPEHVAGYKKHVVTLLDILKRSDAEVWLVPGNNELPNYLRVHCDFPILPQNALKIYRGISMRLSHWPIENEQEAAFAIYGHNFSSDPNHPLDNPKKGVIYLNGVYEWTAIDCATGQYCQISMKERKPR